MKTTNTCKMMLRAIVAAGVLSAMSVATSAHAQTAMNGGGSSAGRLFAGVVGLNLCDAGPYSPIPAWGEWPIHYRTLNNNQHVWKCNRSGNAVIVRYSATASADGIKKLSQATADPLSTMSYLDVDSTTLANNCGTANADNTVITPQATVPHLSRASDGKQYDEWVCPNASPTFLQPVHLGASDVEGGAFGQVGPSLPPPATSQPVIIEPATINGVTGTVLPFAIVVGGNVVRVDSGGLVAGPVQNLTRLQIEQIFAKQITDWRQIGLGTSTTPGTIGSATEATSPITLCPRSAGSGTKASFDQTLMINTTETPAPAATTIFSASSSGVVACIKGNAGRGAGYMDADGVSLASPGYAVSVDGYLPTKVNIECGRYAYWSNWRLYRRNASEGTAIDDLRDNFVTEAQQPSTLTELSPGPGDFWIAPSQMFVTKASTKGPLNWTGGVFPASCRY